MPHMVMDKRDREALGLLMKPFQERARPHIDGAKLASLVACIYTPMSVEYCELQAASHKAHIDAIVAIKRESQAVRDSFVPKYPLVDIITGMPS